MRFYSLLQQVRDLLEHDALGNLLYAKAKFGTYLPLHHPYEDYKTGYAAREDLGGGVIMCLMHEIDYVYYLFGLPREVVAFGGKLSDLEMSVEDTANISVRYENNFSANIILSFAERKEERTLQIVGDKGKIDLDFCEHRLKVYNADKDIFEEFRLNDVDRDDLFADEIKHFVKCIENDQTLRTDLSDGINSLKIAIAVKNSMTQNRIIAL
jgi:predicted dehydrogenase